MVHRLQGRRIVHFLHVPKTGGTAVIHALSGFEKAGDYEIFLHEGHFVNLIHIPRGEKVCLFLRDPISRFVSAFYGRQREDRPRYDNVPWDADEAATFQRFATPNEVALALSSDDPEQRAAAAAAIKTLLQMRIPLWTWFKSKSYLFSRKADILFIGFQETMNEDFDLLKRILNLPDEVRLPEDEVAAHKAPARVDKRLDEGAIRNLKIWFARDYHLLELCREIAARIRSDFERMPSRTPGTKRAGLAPAGGKS
jgi:hypothetical protein